MKPTLPGYKEKMRKEGEVEKGGWEGREGWGGKYGGRKGIYR